MITLQEKLNAAIRDVADYPKPGILFKDITPVFSDPGLMHEVVNALVEEYRDKKIDAIVGVEARGFIIAPIVAYELNCRFIPIRKKGKLPYDTITEDYALEYGTASVEMHSDAIQPGWKVLVHDDLLATGGTAGAAANLVKKLGGEVIGFSFLINLSFLPGDQNLTTRFGVKPHYIISY